MALAQGSIGADVAIQAVEAFLTSKFESEATTHPKRVQKISDFVSVKKDFSNLHRKRTNLKRNTKIIKQNLFRSKRVILFVMLYSLKLAGF